MSFNWLQTLSPSHPCSFIIGMPMHFSPQYTIIDDVNSLRDLYPLATQNIVAIDTEFHAENRYVPQLMPMQIALENGDVLVDPLR